MEGLKARLTQKLGPLPVWGWAAIILGAILLWMYLKGTGFFAGGQGQGQASQGDNSSGLGQLLGNTGPIPNPAATASVGLAGGGGGIGVGGGSVTPISSGGLYAFDPGTSGFGGSSTAPAVSNPPIYASVGSAVQEASQPTFQQGQSIFSQFFSGISGGPATPAAAGVQAIVPQIQPAVQNLVIAARQITPASYAAYAASAPYAAQPPMAVRGRSGAF